MAVRLGLQPQLHAGGPRRRLRRRRGSPPSSRPSTTPPEQFGAAAAQLADLRPGRAQGLRRATGRSSTTPRTPSSSATTSASGELGAALAGDVVSGFAHSADDGAAARTARRQLLEVYVPLQYEGAARPDGAIELYLPYAPVAAAVSEDVRTLTITLVARPRRLLRRRLPAHRRGVEAAAPADRGAAWPPPTATATRPPTTR